MSPHDRRPHRPLIVCPGWRAHHAADPLDAPGEHHVPEVHHRERHLELRGRPVGDLHLRQAALVPAVQQRGGSTAARR